MFRSTVLVLLCVTLALWIAAITVNANVNNARVTALEAQVKLLDDRQVVVGFDADGEPCYSQPRTSVQITPTEKGD